MKILGEKSIDFVSKLINFFYIDNKDKNTIKTLTTNNCKVYNINCTLLYDDFYLSDGCWTSSRKIVDVLSQINQHAKNNPYVVLNCEDYNYNNINLFVNKKDKWKSSFKHIVIV